MTTPPPLPPIDDQARALISAWVEQRGPSPELEARIWAAVSARARAGDLGPDLGPDSGLGSATATATATPRLAGPARLRLALVGLGVTATITALVLAVGARPDHVAEPEQADARAPASVDQPSEAAAPAPQLRSPASLAVEPKPTPEPAPEPTPIASPPAPAPTSKRHTRAKPTAQPPSSPPANTGEDELAAELALLGRARAALKIRDPKAALALLDEHAKRFPNGALRSERELTRITAACSAGELDRAEQVARRFAREHPNSTETKRLVDTCIGDRME